MFIEDENPKDLLAPAERDGLAYHCRKHCAPLERGSCSQPVSINIWLRWSQNTTWLRPPPRCVICGLSRCSATASGFIVTTMDSDMIKFALAAFVTLLVV